MAITKQRACLSKQRYWTKAAAIQSARITEEINQRYGDRHPVSAYRCPYGNHWHIGHELGRRR